MSENENKPDIDELLSCYIDGELSQRQHIEVQRLIEHDEEAAARVAQLRKQKLLLMSMPAESAPFTILEDINRSLERQLILDIYEEQAQDNRGRRSLYYMRAATAAIILALLGMLTVLVVNIVAPVSGPGTYANNDNPGAVTNIDNHKQLPVNPTPVVLAAGEPFKADLVLTTDESAKMSIFVRKAIYNSNLIDNMERDTQALQTVFTVTADVERVAALAAELHPAWLNCSRSSLTIGDDKSNLVIANVTAGQVRSVFTQSQNDKRIQLAKAYSDLNLSGKTDDESLIALSQELENDPTASPVKPIYTSSKKPEPTDTDSEVAAEQVVLVITIKNL